MTSTISDEQVMVARIAYGSTTPDQERMRAAIEAYERTRAPVSVTDEALRIATAKHWRYFNQSSGDAEYCEREAMRVALEAAIPHLAPVSVTNDPRVVELSDDALREVIQEAIGFEWDYGENQYVNGTDLLAVAHAVIAAVAAKAKGGRP